MKAKLFAVSLLLLAVAGLSLLLCGCGKTTAAAVKADEASSAYDTEPDWNDATKVMKLDYQQTQGKRIFYQYCVWCHADATPAGPSNRSNLTPVPPLLNDGEKLNAESDESLQKIISLGGSTLGKSAMMPPYGKTLSPADIKSVIAFARVIAQPAYQPPSHAAPANAAKQ
jgi:mono/diheme cytochrome c family protein